MNIAQDRFLKDLTLALQDIYVGFSLGEERRRPIFLARICAS